MKTRHTLLSFLAIGSCLCALTAPDAQAKVELAWPSHACLETESWSGDVPMVKYLEERTSAERQNPLIAPKTLALASQSLQTVRKTPKTASSAIFVNYVVARSLFSLKLVHPAYQRFQEILATPAVPGSAGIKAAALDCLNLIQARYPSFSPVSEATLVELSKLASDPASRPEVRTAALSATLRRALQRISGGATAAGLSSELAILKSSPADDASARIALASLTPSEQEVISYAKIPELRSADHLALGRAFYGLSDFARAIEQFKLVKTPSRELPDAVLGLGWSYLMLEKKPEALSHTSNLLLGGLSQGFAPEAFSLTAIALNETCNFPEALKILQSFQKAYGRTWQWLSSWQRLQTSKPPQLYSLLAGYLRDPKTLPGRIGTEWARSPRFLANQAELNLLLDETPVAQRWSKAFAKIRPELTQLLDRTLVTLQPREAALIAEINTDLTSRNWQMISALSEVSENMQFIEAEVFNSLGDRIIAAEADASTDSDSPKNGRLSRRGKRKVDPGTWDWGKYEGKGDSAQDEIWEDELGCLRSSIEDKCKGGNS